MKKMLIYILVFIILCFLADTGINASMAKQIDNQSPYCLSFASIGANLLESRLDCWAKIKPAESFQEMDQELIKILDILDIPVDQAAFNHQSDEGKLTLRYQAAKAQSNYIITLQTEKQATYFVLTAISRHDDLTLRADEKKLKNKYKCKSYFQYKGIIESCPDNNGRKSISQVICKCFKAQDSVCYEKGDLISMATFSPVLKNKYDQVVLAGKVYNLQIAISNDSNKNQSYVYLGIPLLLNDY
jgi:hypothetical protein